MATESELASMVVRLIGDAESYHKMMVDAAEQTKKAAQEMEAAKGSATGFTSSLNELGASITAIGGAVTADFGGLAHEAMEGWAEAEGIAIRLEATLKTNGRAVEEVKKDYEEFGAEIQRTTRIGDDAALAILNVAESFGLTGDEAKNATKEAIALAAVTGSSAEAMVRLTAAMAKGDVETAMMFSRMVPQLRGVKNEHEFLARWQKLVDAGWEAETKSAKTFSGQMKQLSEDFGNFLEEVGKVLSEALIPLVKKTKEAVAWLSNLSSGTKTGIAVFLGLGTALGVVLTTIGASILVYNNLIAVVLQYATAANAATAATLGLKAALLIAAFYAGTVLAEALTGAKEELKFLREMWAEDLQKMTEDLNEFKAATKDITTKVTESRTTETRESVRTEALQQATTEVEQFQRELNQAKEVLKDIEDSKSWFDSLAETLGSTNIEAEAFTSKIKEAEQRLSAAKDRVKQLEALSPENMAKRFKKATEELTEKLEDQVRVFGLAEGAAEIYKLRLKGATEAQLANAVGIQQMLEWLKKDKEAKDAVSEANKKVRTDADEMISTLESEIATYGMSAEAAKLYRLEKLGLDRTSAEYIETLIAEKKALDDTKKAAEKGKSLTESILGKDPQEKFKKEMKEIDDLLRDGHITQEVYAMGVKQIKDELDKAGKTAEKTGQKFDQALFGSVEGRQRVQQFYDAIQRDDKRRKGPDVQPREAAAAGGAEARQREEKQAKELEKLRVIAQKQLDKPVIVVEPANFV